MGSTWGKNIVISIFGESHGPEIGCVIDGLPSGVKLNIEQVKKEMARRSAGSYALATPRKEEDKFEIISGFFNGYTTGTPLCAVIKNKDTRSRDYTPELLRPGHADYTAYKRYHGFQDYRGGGHFSGRLTAPLVLAGAIARQCINQKWPDIKIGSRIKEIGKVKDKEIFEWKEYLTLDLTEDLIPLLSPELKAEMLAEIESAKEAEDSVGGIIEGWVTGMPAGIGDPIFGAVESRLASLLFSIPAVKGVEFGTGFDIAALRGSEANDSFYIQDGKVLTQTNHNGGINGGITNAMPIVFRCAIKPTASIKQKQQTVNMNSMQNDEIILKGRHDPCIVLRAHAVVEAATALCMLDLLMGQK